MRDEIGQIPKTGWRRHAALGCVVVLLAFLAGPDRHPVMVGRHLPAPTSVPQTNESNVPSERVERSEPVVLGTPTVIQESPFRIAARINEDRIKESHRFDFDEFAKQLGFDSFDFSSTRKPEAVAQNFNLDGRVGNETVLTITGDCVERLRVFLIFRREQNGWHFLGAMFSYFRWSPPEWRAKSFAGKTFFTFDEQDCYGSAYGCQYESWFEIGGDRIYPAFYFQNSGYSGSMRSALDHETKPQTSGPNRLKLDVTYFLPSRIHADQEKRRPVRMTRGFFFNWNEQRHRFEFDAAASGLTEAEFNAAGDISEGKWEQTAFFKCFDKPLRDAALRGNAAIKKDLRLFLEEWGDASTNAPLLELLDQSAIKKTF